MNKKILANSFGAILALISLTGRLNAQSTEFVPFNTFLDSAKAVNSTVMNRAESRARVPGTFEEMRRHILRMYDGVQVSHSFVKDSSHFDCVPVEQQPSVRMQGLGSLATAPPQSMLTRPASGNDGSAEGPIHTASQIDAASSFDEFGNSTRCEENTIPMRRITLEDMTRFSTLREFFQKGPDGAGRPIESKPEVAPASASGGHKYAFMLQKVNNIGGSSHLNLWNPSVNTSYGELMSLSQQWYVGGSGAAVQTAEVGWQVQPSFWGTQKSVLFIYWTADNYKDTGCYNLSCPGFVQVSSQAILGSSFDTVSAAGGTQYDFGAEFYLYAGNWWLAIDGNWIGYYPGDVYRGGQLTRYAESIMFGTESIGSTVWPAEGSGYWATSGWSYAAYQRNMFYREPSGAAFWTTLTPQQPSPACYSTYGPFTNSSSDWQVFFYAGGPGGSGC